MPNGNLDEKGHVFTLLHFPSSTTSDLSSLENLASTNLPYYAYLISIIALLMVITFHFYLDKFCRPEITCRHVGQGKHRLVHELVDFCCI